MALWKTPRVDRFDQKDETHSLFFLSSLLFAFITSTEKGRVIKLVAEADLYFQRTIYDIPVAIPFSLGFQITPRA